MMNAMLYEDYLRQQVDRGEFGVCIIPADIATGIAEYIERHRNDATIVRCKDCKYCYSIDSDPMEPYNGENYWYCERWDKSTSAYGTDPERFYCADAERRDGE